LIWGYFSPQFFLCGHACEGWPLFFPLSNGDFSMQTITLTIEEANDILAALIRMEHKTTGSMQTGEYWATCTLAQKVEAPQSIAEYFATKALESGNDDTYDKFGVNTRNTFNTAPKE
jgi:hypothetical protein